MKLTITCCLLLSGIAISFITPLHQADGWTYLFNGKDLSGWDTWLGPPLDDNGKKITDQPIGLNIDPNHVFTVVEQDGEKIIRISGNGWGWYGMYTICGQ